MKIFSAEKIRKCDEFTIENEPVSSINLMERAAEVCTKWLVSNSKNNEKFFVFCGKGNNGGDGFAIARLMYEKGYDITVFTNLSTEKFSTNASVNLSKIKEISGIEIFDFSEVSSVKFPLECTFIDAIFGSGLKGILDGTTAEVVQFLNKKECRKIAVDIPSGLLSDDIPKEGSVIFKADHTLSFQFWKKTFLHSETAFFCGKIHILDIGLSGKYIHETPSSEFIICEKLIKTIYRPRPHFSHKGDFGKTCIAAGSFGKIGAAVLAVSAALRSGSGLTFALSPKCGFEILQTTCPEAMFVDGGENKVTRLNVEEDWFFATGPGLGTDSETAEKLLEFINKYEKPLVLDADALNIISADKKRLKTIPAGSIITPHPKEFERLFGKTHNSFERTRLAQIKSQELKIIIILKGHHTQIITPDEKIFYNITGNSGMAKGGSGDVLTGILVSLLAQGYSSEETAVLGTWLHGKAGDFASEKYGKEAMLASDLINEIGTVFKQLNNDEENLL